MIDDERNRLYKSYVNIVSIIKPKAFVMENVPGLVRLFKGKVAEQVKEDFTNIGYSVQMKILSADNYGVPQQRKRVFFVGIRKDLSEKGIKYFYPEPIMGEGTGINSWTCKDAISDLDFVPDDRVLGEEIEYVLPAENEYQKVMREGSKKRIKSFNNLAYRKEQKKLYLWFRMGETIKIYQRIYRIQGKCILRGQG